jgi:two-component system LytT family sensor kinase
LFKINDTWFRLLIIILPFGEGIWAKGLLTHPFNGKWIAVFLVSLFATVLICEGNRYIIYRSRTLFQRQYNAWRRTIICVTAGILFTTVVLAASFITHGFLRTGNFSMDVQVTPNMYVNNTPVVFGLWTTALIKAIVFFSVLFVVYESFYHFARLRFTENERERLEKEKLRAELQQLKGIVNPHFLFNNLNSLSALISENPPQAEVFLDELTRVFRYLLKNNDTELIPLSQELQFVQSYYNLLQTRYGSGISLDINVQPQYKELLIAPLTLQLLIENAVKHNRVQQANPLQIELYVTIGNKLVVRNNVSKKEGKIDSTGIGLQNINSRYNMLNLPVPVIEKNEIFFSVIIQLAGTITAQQETSTSQVLTTV